MGKDALSTKNVGDHPEAISFHDGRIFEKVCDLRYGTNPPQTAALYGKDTFLGSLRGLRVEGKEGPSQTNMEDIVYAATVVGYFDGPSVIVMKHVNPSGFATQYESEALATTYKKARDVDFRAAFGGVVLLNRQVDIDTTEAMRELFTEVVVAPGFDEGVMERFKGSTRVFEYKEDAFKAIPRYVGDPCEPQMTQLLDGSIILADPFLSPIRGVDDLRQYVVSNRQPTERELRDLLTGLRLRLRSNSIGMVKDGYTTALGLGQQDRVMCIKIADYKNRELAELAAEEGKVRAADYSIAGSVLDSDGFFPFTDSVEAAKDLGVTALLAPHGGKNFEKVLEAANDADMTFVDLPGKNRFFRH